LFTTAEAATTVVAKTASIPALAPLALFGEVVRMAQMSAIRTAYNRPLCDPHHFPPTVKGGSLSVVGQGSKEAAMVTQILIALIATAAAAVMGSGQRDNR
jgi:hypothetical protein